ncbi:MAG: RpiB/LacA/LacB family sugar-phosphate isomerase [Blastocatellia bacterium]|nr:RpiB/LacA/LacB family sugar-phosphate isomerase [Blastocatellia bacterium]
MSARDEQNRDAIRSLVREAVRRQVGGSADGAPAPSVVDESVKNVITEADVRDLAAGATLLVREEAIITPAAQDLIRERGIEVRRRAARVASGARRIVAVASDHGGFAMKERLKRHLEELGYAPRDFGTFSEEAVDYPDYAHAVAKAVADGACDLGIVIDGAGIGSCMTANKVPGVRAAMCYDTATARNSREHNYANVLTLGGKMISDDAMREIVAVWLATPEGEDRHGRRVAKIMAVEKQYLR